MGKAHFIRTSFLADSKQRRFIYKLCYFYLIICVNFGQLDNVVVFRVSEQRRREGKDQRRSYLVLKLVYEHLQ